MKLPFWAEVARPGVEFGSSIDFRSFVLWVVLEVSFYSSPMRHLHFYCDGMERRGRWESKIELLGDRRIDLRDKNRLSWVNANVWLFLPQSRMIGVMLPRSVVLPTTLIAPLAMATMAEATTESRQALSAILLSRHSSNWAACSKAFSTFHDLIFRQTNVSRNVESYLVSI